VKTRNYRNIPFKHTVSAGQTSAFKGSEIPSKRNRPNSHPSPRPDAPHSHSMVNKPLKASRGAGFPVVTSVDTMNNTIVKNSWGNLLQCGFNAEVRTD
jgi:hypothetical protein